MITSTDVTVWVISGLMAAGLGWSRYAKAKTRRDLVRQIAAMDVEGRRKMLSRLQPKLALEVRQELLERFQILA